MIERQRQPDHQLYMTNQHHGQGQCGMFFDLLDSPLSLAADLDRCANDLMPVVS